MDVLATLAGNFEAGTAIWAGLVAGVAFLGVVYMGLAVGMTRMNFLRILGTMMVPKGPMAAAYVVGLMVHLMLSAVFGLVHAGLLHAIDVSTVGEATAWDLVIGGAHGVAILVALPMMLMAMHPLIRRGELAPPGVALAGYGSMTPIGSLMAHIAFGAVVGAIYAGVVL